MSNTRTSDDNTFVGDILSNDIQQLTGIYDDSTGYTVVRLWCLSTGSDILTLYFSDDGVNANDTVPNNCIQETYGIYANKPSAITSFIKKRYVKVSLTRDAAATTNNEIHTVTLRTKFAKRDPPSSLTYTSDDITTNAVISLEDLTVNANVEVTDANFTLSYDKSSVRVYGSNDTPITTNTRGNVVVEGYANINANPVIIGGIDDDSTVNALNVTNGAAFVTGQPSATNRYPVLLGGYVGQNENSGIGLKNQIAALNVDSTGRLKIITDTDPLNVNIVNGGGGTVGSVTVDISLNYTRDSVKSLLYSSADTAISIVNPLPTIVNTNQPNTYSSSYYSARNATILDPAIAGNTTIPILMTTSSVGKWINISGMKKINVFISRLDVNPVNVTVTCLFLTAINTNSLLVDPSGNGSAYFVTRFNNLYTDTNETFTGEFNIGATPEACLRYNNVIADWVSLKVINGSFRPIITIVGQR